MIENVTIVGTGLIGSSVALSLRRAGYAGGLYGWDSNAEALAECARVAGVVALESAFSGSQPLREGVVVLAGPVLSILDWMERLAAVCGERVLITDVGSTKVEIVRAAERLYNRAGRARFLPGHPMAGKEQGGAGRAEAELFEGAMWLFTPVSEEGALEREWRGWVKRMGARTMELEAGRHDVICAWVSHLPQMVATAMAAMFEDEFAAAPELGEEFRAIGGRALREMTRLGASPYSMWRDVAFTNTEAIAGTLLALEQRLAHVRENLRTPELREEFGKANGFRRKQG